MDSLSFSNSLSKGSVYESESFFKAYRDDAASHLAGDAGPVAISNERIQRGDVILDTYRVEGDAILGGMGSVWRVHHQSWDTDLAMKRPQPRFFAEGSERRKEEFIAECEHWINLGLHPNIVSCYYVREIGGVPTIFSEWMDGGSLKDAIQSGRLYAGAEQEVQARILDIAIQAARGLQYSHEQGLIHQDVKPGNILLTKDWDAKVADFGLARAQSQLTDGEKPLSGGYTPAYCPKEQADGAPAEKWMDVYAWTLTVAEMYLGGHPWLSGAAASEGLEGYRAAARVAPPEAVWALLARCLKDRAIDFSAAEAALMEAWRAVAGGDYPRQRYRATGASADNLNNYAMSMLDLGMPRAAEEAWDEAIRQSPDHAASIANRAFYLWHTARIGDDKVLDTLKALPDSPEKAEAMETFAVESGEKPSPEDGVTEADIPLAVDHNVCDACFEGDAGVWLAMRTELARYDARTGERLRGIEAKQAGMMLVLAAATADGRALYTGEADSLARVDIAADCALTPVALVPTRQERAARYPEASTVVKGKRYRFDARNVSWLSMWLEDGDSTLCVIEESRWKNPDDLEKYARWCNNPADRAFPKPPRVDERSRYHLLRYRLDAPDRATLASVAPVEAETEGTDSLEWDRDITCKVLNFKVAACARPEDRWVSVVTHNYLGTPVARLRDARTGRFVRSADGNRARIIAFSPDNRRYLFATGDNTISAKYSVCLRRTPENGAGNRLYALCRVKDVATLQREDAAAQAAREAFERALERRDYAAAIARFDEYRALPDRRDAAETVAMERKLDAVCRRARLNHLAPPMGDAAGFDMSPYTFGWVMISTSGYRRCDGSAGSLANTRYEAPAARARETVVDRLPIAFRDDSGEKRTLEGDLVFTRVLSEDLQTAYVSVEKRGPGAKLGVVEVKLNAGRTRVVALDARAPVPTPDGARLVECRDAAVAVFDGTLTPALLRVDTGDRDGLSHLVIFPDSRFALYTTSYHRKTGIISLHAARSEDSRDCAQCVPLPPLPEVPPGMSPRGICLTADGCHILRQFTKERRVMENGLNVIKDREAVDIPWLRLSWDYAPPEAKTAKADARGDGKAAAPGLRESAPPRRGLFSRLFGRK